MNARWIGRRLATIKVPQFDSLSGEAIHGELAMEMLKVYRQADSLKYLDESATRLLAEGQKAFEAYGLAPSPFIFDGRHTFVAVWQGTAAVSLTAIAFAMAGYECEPEEIGFIVRDCSPDDVRHATGQIANSYFEVTELASFVQNIRSAKYDDYVSDDLLRRLWSNRHHTAMLKLMTILQSLSA